MSTTTRFAPRYFTNLEIGLAIAGSFLIQASFVTVLTFGIDQKIEKPTFSPNESSVKVTPVIDLDSPMLKYGNKKYKLPEAWIPKVKPVEPDQSFVSTKTDPLSKPPVDSNKPLASASTPPPLDSSQTSPSATILTSSSAVPTDGHESGTIGGTETDPLKARAISQYRGRVVGWLTARFGVHGTGLSQEELKALKVSATVQIGGDRSVLSYSIQSSGNAAFDAAAKRALDSVVGTSIPQPPEAYPDIVKSQIQVTFVCTKGQCD